MQQTQLRDKCRFFYSLLCPSACCSAYSHTFSHVAQTAHVRPRGGAVAQPLSALLLRPIGAKKKRYLPSRRFQPVMSHFPAAKWQETLESVPVPFCFRCGPCSTIFANGVSKASPSLGCRGAVAHFTRRRDRANCVDRQGLHRPQGRGRGRSIAKYREADRGALI